MHKINAEHMGVKSYYCWHNEGSTIGQPQCPDVKFTDVLEISMDNYTIVLKGYTLIKHSQHGIDLIIFLKGLH